MEFPYAIHHRMAAFLTVRNHSTNSLCQSPTQLFIQLRLLVRAFVYSIRLLHALLLLFSLRELIVNLYRHQIFNMKQEIDSNMVEQFQHHPDNDLLSTKDYKNINSIFQKSYIQSKQRFLVVGKMNYCGSGKIDLFSYTFYLIRIWIFYLHIFIMMKLQKSTSSPVKSQTGSNRSDNYFLMIGHNNRRKLQLQDKCLAERIDAQDYQIYLQETKDQEKADQIVILEEEMSQNNQICKANSCSMECQIY